MSPASAAARSASSARASTSSTWCAAPSKTTAPFSKTTRSPSTCRTKPVRIDGDPTRLAQVIGNLLSNAAKFTPKDGKISVSLTQAEGHAVLEVADTGTGIDPDTLERLFEPFAQADRSLDRSRGGLGLGLALVKGMVELHGGEVSATATAPGRAHASPSSSRSTSAWQISRRRRRQARPACREAGAHHRGQQGRGRQLGGGARTRGHQVAVAYDGDAGLAKAREFRPEIVLCDIGLPGVMDGYAVARALRKEPATASAYLVALTGYAQPEDQRRALDAGFDAHLAKPPDIEALRRLLSEATPRTTRTSSHP